MGDYNFKSKDNSLNSKRIAMKDIKLDGSDQYEIMNDLINKFFPIINWVRYSSLNTRFTPLNKCSLSEDKRRFKSTFIITLIDATTNYEFDVKFDFEVVLKGVNGRTMTRVYSVATNGELF